MIVFFLASLHWAAGQTVQFNSISLKDGLPQASVTCIMQDRDGFVWVGTQDGLSRYDGYSFVTIRNSPGDNESLSSNNITAIHQDASGYIWVGTTFGLNRLDPYTFRSTNFYHWFEDKAALSNNKITAIAEDQYGRIWIGTNNGLNLLVSETGRFMRYLIQPNDSTSLSSNVVNCLRIDHHNKLWVGTTGGLNCFRPESNNFKRYRQKYEDENSLSDNDILSIEESSDGILWLGTRNGLNKFKSELEIFSRYYKDEPKPGLLSSNIITSLLIDRNGDLWVGTPSGLNRFYTKVNESTVYRSDSDELHTLPSDYIHTLMSDRSGMIWIGTQSAGIATLNQEVPQFSSVSFPGVLGYEPEQNKIFNFCQIDSSSIYIGTGKGVAIFNPNSGKTEFLSESDDSILKELNEAVKYILEDEDGIIWLATHGKGLISYNPTDGTSNEYLQNSEDPKSISSNKVSQLLRAQRGGLWVATIGGGLCRYMPETDDFKVYRFDGADPRSLRDNNILCLSYDAVGTLWLGTGNAGLYSFNETTETFTHYSAGDIKSGKLGSNTINTLHLDDAGRLWIGTAGGGLSRWNQESEKFESFTQNEGLASNVVIAITSDSEGNIWMSTNGGVSAFYERTETFRNYNEQDVLGKNTFYQGSCFRDTDKRIYFGGANGFDFFYGEGLRENDFIPSLHITGIQLFEQNQRINPLDLAKQVSDTLMLRHDHSGFSIEFSALNYKQPDKNQYAYRLIGLFDDWRYTGNRRIATFTNLSPGTYTFEVIGSNNDGLWNENPVGVTIIVNPALWQTGFFRVVVTLLIVTLLYVLFRFRIRADRARRKALESAVISRTREISKERDTNAVLLREVHHRVKNNLQIIVSLLSLQSRYITDTKLTGVFGEIQNRVRSMSLIHQKMYQSKDLSSVNIEEYINDLSNSLLNTYRLAQKVTLDVEVQVNRFKSDTLTPLGLIINEVITNSLKYAFREDREGKIFVRLNRLENGRFRLIIGDDGVGMALNLSHPDSESFGTELISALTEQLNGDIVRLNDRPGTVYQIDFEDVTEDPVS